MQNLGSIPLRSRFGNRVTKFFQRLAQDYGMKAGAILKDVA